MLDIKRIGNIGKTYKHLKRYRQILKVVIKYGFGNIIDILNINQYFEIGFHIFADRNTGEIIETIKAKRVRLLVEELGPAFIKLGQILSTRPDIISHPFIKEFQKLQDDVSPFPDLDVNKIIKSEFYPESSPFNFIADKPFASASIGQVYFARLKNDESVAVKIQRPGIKKIIDVDLEIMCHLAILAERHSKKISFFRPVKIIKELVKSFEKELDYTLEAKSMQKVAQQYLFDTTIYIPKVFVNNSTSKILTMEYVKGIKISEIDKLDANGYDRKLIVKRGADFIFKQFFQNGLFHADLHPGNLFVLPKNVLCLIDFGIMGFIGRETRENFIDLVNSVVTKNYMTASHFLLKLTEYEKEPDFDSLEKDISQFINSHINCTLKDINMKKLSVDFLNIAAKHGLRIYPEAFIMIRTFASVEGIAFLLDPEFNIIEYVTPFIKKIKYAQFSEERIKEDINSFFFTSLEILQDFPLESYSITKQLKKDKLSVVIDFIKQDTVLLFYQKIFTKISFSVIIASLIIGSALIFSLKIPPFISGVPVMGILGFTMAAFLGLCFINAKL